MPKHAKPLLFRRLKQRKREITNLLHWYGQPLSQHVVLQM
jgi:hypothetical protein